MKTEEKIKNEIINIVLKGHLAGQCNMNAISLQQLALREANKIIRIMEVNLKLHDVREILKQYNADKITLSRMTEMLNEKINTTQYSIDLEEDSAIKLIKLTNGNKEEAVAIAREFSYHNFWHREFTNDVIEYINNAN